ncbi:cytosolic Fe-S cluster assembly factor NAR1 [Microthyrium microscopicum]|uniref:Cytosolic Fe-S cluster assembly factor NAR1 n=1 Tax=Microthyrium microscopicum TaxID=703497 RepID=A0A6A6U971_9PEZI|nr:cytosolic Fe-S cluster assembly factor NAR1 [Microthyrium microscopicum]
MSAILSADDLNDFISPGVACIKPIESLPSKPDPENPYEVTTEDKLAAANPAPAQITLTDCLACSGCVTSAEAVLVSLQSHAEVLGSLDRWPNMELPERIRNGVNGHGAHTDGITAMNGSHRPNGEVSFGALSEGKVFVATLSPQVRASIAATFGVSERKAGNMIAQLLSGPDGLASGGQHGSKFQWVLDSNVFREMSLVASAEEVSDLLQEPDRKRPILTSACPGWICYAEKTHPHVLPHLSRLKSPQALAGTLVKSVLTKHGIHPSNVWHLAIMPCFDKKLEASRSELTSALWHPSPSEEPIRDVDCVITARELISLASARGIPFHTLPSTPVAHQPFPDATLRPFLFPSTPRKASPVAGTSGGFLHHILLRLQAAHPHSTITSTRGRNADVHDYALLSADGTPIVQLARFYGFRNIQNLVRKLNPPKPSRLLAASRTSRIAKAVGVPYAYVEVMACPGGCTNGGGQIRAGEVNNVRAGEGLPEELERVGPGETKAWLGAVDEAYFSAESEDDDAEMMDVDENGTGSNSVEDGDLVDGISRRRVLGVLEHWAQVVGVPVQDLICTSYRKVESDVGKKVSDVERVAGLASSLGGGW